jgi:hypothetical protein
MDKNKDKEKYFIRSFTKVFKEGADKYWWFNVSKYIDVAEKYDFDETKIREQIELTEEDVSKKLLHPRTIKRVLQFCEGYVVGKDKKDQSVTIDTIKDLGKALCNDEYAFLIEIEPNNVMRVMEQADEFFGVSDINGIYGMLNKLLYELEISSYYSFKPGTKEDGFNYYDMQLQYIRTEIDKHFWKDKETRDKLYRLVEEEESMIKSFSRPGAPERWVKCNPNLRYYDCVFDFIEENPELYNRIKNEEMTTASGLVMSFNFYPDEEECRERKRYFDDLYEKCRRQNSRYSIDRLYQNELIEAFRMVFEEDFK